MEPVTPLVETFTKHVVPVFLQFSKANEAPRPYLFCTFAIEVRGHWLLATAGHCLQNVEVFRRQGWAIEKARLVDALSVTSKYLDPVPFDFDVALPLVPLDGDCTDYGLLILGDLETAQLKANGVIPLGEGAWPNDLVEPELFFVCGVPEQGSVVTIEHVHLKAISALLKRLDKCPAELEEHPLRCYFEVIPTDKVPSLKGVSGGPIFAAKFVNDRMKYWIWGVQSSQAGQFPEKPYIAANLVGPLVNFLGEVADGKHSHLLDGGRAAN